MVNFPIFNRLDIEGYGLYPGQPDLPGLHVQFEPGLTLAIGANGLGKSTLVGILYRLLSGPYDIAGLAARGDLGNMKLTATPLSSGLRGTFGHRVVDGGRTATACLKFTLGSARLEVTRRLSDLSLTRFAVDGEELAVSELEVYQPEIIRRVGVWSFGDWILLLRHLVFYFEDRRALVWDPSAQRQILRFLFLPPDTAQTWSQAERDILELDSRMRNLSAATTREQKALAKAEVKAEDAGDLRAELSALEKSQTHDEGQRETLEDQLSEVDERREQARLRHLKAEHEHESRFRELERARLLAIGARFPNQSDTARYIFAQLLTEDTCLVCGHSSPVAAAEYLARLGAHRCVVCDSDVSADVSQSRLAEPTDLTEKRWEKAGLELSASERDLLEATQALADAEAEYQAHLFRIQELNVAIAERVAKIDSLVKRLPLGETVLHRQRADLASMRSRVAELRQELDSKRELFRVFVREMNQTLSARSEEVQRSFDSYAEGFLLEICRLVWSIHKDRLGETGDLFEFPAFELELSGTNFPSPVRRTGPDQVSESQREFIDLAFRMALIATAGAESVGTLVIDAPESSLDAVFVERAASVLSRFATPSGGSRLFVTSNLTEGGLIPSLLKRSVPHADRGSRILDLFEVAEPTAAIRQLRDEYAIVRAEFLGEVQD